MQVIDVLSDLWEFPIEKAGFLLVSFGLDLPEYNRVNVVVVDFVFQKTQFHFWGLFSLQFLFIYRLGIRKLYS